MRPPPAYVAPALLAAAGCMIVAVVVVVLVRNGPREPDEAREAARNADTNRIVVPLAVVGVLCGVAGGVLYFWSHSGSPPPPPPAIGSAA